MEEIVSGIAAKHAAISCDSEGFVASGQMPQALRKCGSVKTAKIACNTFRGSRSLRRRDIHVIEHLLVLGNRQARRDP